MDTPTFIEEFDTVEPDTLPPLPVSTEVVRSPTDRTAGGNGQAPTIAAELKSEHFMEFGTDLDAAWDDEWIQIVSLAEQEKHRAICGGRKTPSSLKTSIEAGKFTEQDLLDNPTLLTCKNPAGLRTNHPGSGRCSEHGGNRALPARTGRFALLRHSRLGPKVSDYFEMEQLMDLRSAIAIIYASMDEMLGIEEEITPERAKQIADLMAKVGTLTKQHNDITASKQVTIEVPEFMAWAEFFYELAIKYIKDGKGDIAGFLGEAQRYYNATVTLTIGDERVQAAARRDSAGALGSGSGVEVVGVSRTGVEES